MGMLTGDFCSLWLLVAMVGQLLDLPSLSLFPCDFSMGPEVPFSGCPGNQDIIQIHRNVGNSLENPLHGSLEYC
eukprot:superscaffoldBa00000330_g3848